MAIETVNLRSMMSSDYGTIELYSEFDKGRISNAQARKAKDQANIVKNREDAAKELHTLNADKHELGYKEKHGGQWLELGKTSVRVRYFSPVSLLENNREGIQEPLYRYSKRQRSRACLVTFDVRDMPENQFYVFYAFFKKLLESVDSNKHGCCIVSVLLKNDEDPERNRLITAPFFDGASAQPSLASARSTIQSEHSFDDDHSERGGPSEEKAFGDQWGHNYSGNTEISNRGKAVNMAREITVKEQYVNYQYDTTSFGPHNKGFQASHIGGPVTDTNFYKGPSVSSSAFSPAYPPTHLPVSQAPLLEEMREAQVAIEHLTFDDASSGRQSYYTAKEHDPTDYPVATSSHPRLTNPARGTGIEQRGQSIIPASSSTASTQFNYENGQPYVNINGRSKWVSALTTEERNSLGRPYVEIDNERIWVDKLTDEERTFLGINHQSSNYSQAHSPSASQQSQEKPEPTVEENIYDADSDDEARRARPRRQIRRDDATQPSASVSTLNPPAAAEQAPLLELRGYYTAGDSGPSLTSPVPRTDEGLDEHNSSAEESEATETQSISGKSLQWYIEAAEQGDTRAQNWLGYIYSQGKGVTQSHTEGLKWFKKSAEKRNAMAQYNLGVMYQVGLGVTQNNVETFKWYKKSAEKGNAYAQSNLGYMYYTGKGVMQSYTEDFKWCKKAAEDKDGKPGNAYAQSNLGLMYLSGNGVTQDDTEAFKWYKKSAKQGNANSQSNLGMMYFFGTGVKQSDTEAFKWFEKGAEQDGKDIVPDLRFPPSDNVYSSTPQAYVNIGNTSKWLDELADEERASFTPTQIFYSRRSAVIVDGTPKWVDQLTDEECTLLGINCSDLKS